MNTKHSNSKCIVVTAAFLFSPILFAQAPRPKPNTVADTCSQPLVLKIDLVSNRVQYELNGQVSNGYPLDAVAHEMENCWPDKPLFVVASWDVPLYALTTPEKLQLNKVRYFIKGRDERIYTEIAYGRMYPSLPVTSDIAPLPEDDGTLHPPTKIPHTKGQQ